MKSRSYFWVLGVLLVLLLSACRPSLYNQSQLNVDQTMEQIRREKAAEKNNPIVREDPGFYVSTKPTELNTPIWYQKPISLHAKNMPFQLLVSQALGSESIVPSYGAGVNADSLLSLNYSGTVKGALDLLAAKTGYSYKVHDAQLAWSAFETRTFNISFMPGTTAYSVGQSQSGGGGGSSSTPGSGSTGSSSNLNALQDDQFSRLQGELSVWKDLRDTLEQLKSPKGKVVVSEATTTVTVSDYPGNVEAMAAFIAELNKVLNQQVQIAVQVIEIELDNSFNFGVNWQLVGEALKIKYALTAAEATAANVDSSSSGISTLSIGQSSAAILQALSEQGRIRVVTRPTVVTMNNQMASIRITQDTGYLQSVSTTLTQDQSQTALNPGTVTDGFTLYLLPKIQDETVYLQISSTIANLVSMAQQSSAPAGTETSPSSSYQAIQTPTLAQKIFNQRSRIHSGSTLIIAGYKRLRDETRQDDFYGTPALGARGSQSTNVETLVLITPTIIKSDR